jgi:putative sterol carrier protein
MPFYANADTFYPIIKEVFARIEQESPHAIHGLMRSKLIVRLKLTHPMAEITLNGRRATFQAMYGPSKLLADLDAHFTGDTLHKIFLGQWTLAHALNIGQLRINGPILKALEMAELFEAAKKIYPAVLKERGMLK